MAGRPRAPVELPPEIAARFGLGEEGASVRVLEGGRRILLLERVGGEGPPLPWDRDLVLSAEVRAFSIADVLQLVHAAGKSGFLYFEHGDCAKSVFLHAGEVVFASSNQRIDRLGECLVRAGVITREQHREAQAEYAPSQQFGRFLVDRGVLSARELWDGVKAQVEEIVRSLFAFATGQVFFWEGEVRPDNVVRLALPTGRLIEEGLGHRDDLLVFLAHLEDARVLIEAVEGAAARLEGTEAAIVKGLHGVGTFQNLCREVGIDPLSAARTVQLLDQMGAVRIVRVKMPAEPGAATEDGLRGCVRAHVKLLAELTAPIVAVEGSDPLRRRLAEVTQEAAARHPELLAALDLGPGGVLDPESLIARALRYPGDREREVREALGELVSYVEFELLNHPQVQDAEDFLEVLEPLRTAL